MLENNDTSEELLETWEEVCKLTKETEVVEDEAIEDKLEFLTTSCHHH